MADNAAKGKRVDLRISDEARKKEGRRTEDLVFRINQTSPLSEEYNELIHELFEEMGDSTSIKAPILVNLANNVYIGRNVSIMPYIKMMSAGRIIIENDVMIAMNVSIITNNHDVYDRPVLTVQDVVIKQGAWIGAGSTILPGVTVGKYAVVGAGSVVTKDVPDYGVVVGNPAKLIKMLDPEKFEQAEA